MSAHDEMTRHAFISNMEAYIRQLLKDPSKADTSRLLKRHGIDNATALINLLKRKDPSDPASSVLTRTEQIKTNVDDKTGKRKPDTFRITYKLNRDGYAQKMRNMYIELFESNIIPGTTLEEGAWGEGPLDSDQALDYQDKVVKDVIKDMLSDVKNSGKPEDKWTKAGVLYDLLNKYKDNEVGCSDEYGTACDELGSILGKLLEDEEYINTWKYPENIRKSIGCVIKKLDKFMERCDIKKKVDEEAECDGATTCDASSGQYTMPLTKKPVKRTIYATREQIERLLEATAGDIGQGYEVPFTGVKKGDPSLNHKDMMAKSFAGVDEASIEIDPENKGKFNATKKRTGKSTEELTHSKNPLTRRRAIFAQNAKKWNKKK